MSEFHNIWMYWHQGWEEAPEVVLKCRDSWEKYNTGWNILFLDQYTLQSYIESSVIEHLRSKRKLSIAALSDLIRLSLLDQHGGIWVDSTVLCLRPLGNWLELDRPFFAFGNPGSDRMLSTWFLYSAAASYTIQEWHSAANKYWESWKWRRPYYWCHYLFADLYRKDAQFRKHWDNRQVISAEGPHRLVPFRQRFFEKASNRNLQFLKDQNLPLLKLTYKCLHSGYEKGTVIDYVLNEMN